MRSIYQACPAPELVPPELLAERRWVCWRYETPPGRKETKVPYRPGGGGRASSTDPTTWGTFHDAATTATLGDYSGVGFMLGDGFAGVDLDDCLNDPGHFIWGADIVASMDATYWERSPSGMGVKGFMLGVKPGGRSKAVGIGPQRRGAIEVYDSGRYFAFTGDHLPGTAMAVTDCTAELSELDGRYFSDPAPTLNGHAKTNDTVNGHANGTANTPPSASSPGGDPRAVRLAIADMLTKTANMADGGDGSFRLVTACCRAVEHGLNDRDAVVAIEAYAKLQPFPTTWTVVEIMKRLRDAEKKAARGSKVVGASPVIRQAVDLIADHPDQRPPIIDGLIRVGETLNLVSGPKTFKSHTVAALLIAAATGGRWLDTYAVEQGRVLLIDNELYSDTIAARLRAVTHGAGLSTADLADRFDVATLRGNLQNIHQLDGLFRSIVPGTYSLIALDAIYRMLPDDEGAENSNSVWAGIYNAIDRHAMRLGCGFVVVHHSSKGSQGDKAITDVGAGAGAQSRAADCHMIIRRHEEDDAVVVEAEVRTFAKPTPLGLRWAYPLWRPDPSLDPTMLKRERGRGGRPKSATQAPAAPAKTVYTPDTFAAAFVNDQPKAKDVIVARATHAGLSGREVSTLLALAIDARMVFKHTLKNDRTVYLATTEPDLIPFDSHARTPPTPPTSARRGKRRVTRN